MDKDKADRQLDKLRDLDFVVRYPLVFKSQLGIGGDAYSSLWLSKRLQSLWDVGGVAMTGAQIVKSTTVAGAFFAPQGWLAAVGLGGAAATPIGWVAAAAIASAGAYYGVTRLIATYSADRVSEVPKFITTPLDILAVSLFDLLAPLALKVATADGRIDRQELEVISSHFVEDWGFDASYVEMALPILLENSAVQRIDDTATALAKFKNENPDCNPSAIRKVLLRLLRQVAEADGKLSEEEEMSIERIDSILRKRQGQFLGLDKVAAAAGGVVGSVSGTITAVGDKLGRGLSRGRDHKQIVVSAATELETPATHLYPGARLHVVSRGETPEAILRFGDGVSVAAELTGGELIVQPYRTAAGTRIERKRWAVEETGSSLRVTGRLAAG